MGQIKNIKLHIVTDIKERTIVPRTYTHVTNNSNNNNKQQKMANVDTHEEFWGITLGGEKKVHMWNPASDEEEIEHKIQVTQACLGSKAKEGERNVVEVVTEDDNSKKISCAVVSLRVGFIECMHPELGFTNAVKFSLKEGNGPLSLCGVHLMALPLDLNNMGDESSDEDEEEVPQLVKPVATKAVALEEVKKVVEEKIETEEAPAVKESEAVVVVEAKKEEKVKEEAVAEEKAEVAEEKKPKKRVASDEEEEVAAKMRKRKKRKQLLLRRKKLKRMRKRKEIVMKRIP